MPTAHPTRRASTSRTASACFRQTWPRRWATTSWSPTPSTTALRGRAAVHRRRSRTLAGNGEPWMQGERHRQPLLALGRRLVAGPGLGRDGRHPPALDLRPAHRCGRRWPQAPPTKGSSTGPLADAWFAQPSGLSADGDRLWIADAEVLGAALDRRRGRAHRRRAGALRLRVPRRQGRRGTLPAPARRGRAPRRDGGRRRHLQRRRPPLRPEHDRGHHAGDRPSRGVRSRRHRGRSRRGRVRRTPAELGAAVHGGQRHGHVAHKLPADP